MPLTMAELEDMRAEAFADDFEDLRFRQPDLSRIRKAIGFDPRISIETTIDDLARELGS